MTRDAALIIAAQKIEHYEIASYGGLVQLAITLGKHRAADILDKTLSEEEETDQLLTDIAEGHINIEAEEEEEDNNDKRGAPFGGSLQILTQKKPGKAPGFFLRF